jgi:acetyltransferase
MILSSETQPITIRQTPASAIESMLPTLIERLQETVSGGVGLGFFAPLSYRMAREYWLSIIPELVHGSRILLTAHDDSGFVGCGQLALSQRQNSPHRAEVEKLFVATAARGKGVGTALMEGLHHTALAHGRTLILLNTRADIPARQFYKSLGYREVGVIPGWTVSASGERYDHVTLYKELTYAGAARGAVAASSV